MAIKRAKGLDKKPLFDEAGNPVWEIDIRISQGAGKPRRRVRTKGFTSRAEAERAIAAIRETERAARYGFALAKDRPRLQQLITLRLATITPTAERSRARRVLFTWLRLLDPLVTLDERFCPVGGYQSPVTVEGLETPQIRQYATLRTEQGQAASSVNRELNVIAATLNAAASFFPELNSWRPPRIPRLKVKKSRRERILSEEEYVRLLTWLRRPPDALDGDARAQNRHNAHQARVRVGWILQFAMLSGARHSEIVGLRWTDIDRDNGRVLIYQAKTDRYKQIPITEPMRDVLAEAEQGKRGAFVFGASGKIYPKFYRILKTACEQCEIPYGKRTADGVVLHTTRHTVTTRLANAGMDFDTIGQITGHTAKELIAHYLHHTPGAMGRAAQTLAQIGQSVDRNDKSRCK
ncbi:MAG: tyrosine-type recombinase/integrase [Acidobacteria bacterium]|nr:tyrosine-type recombinase/integrase [Acidobacteriota bacterium]